MNYQIRKVVNLNALAARREPMPLPFSHLLACPDCLGPVDNTAHMLQCTACGATYARAGGAPQLDLRLPRPKRRSITLEVGTQAMESPPCLAADLPPKADSKIPDWAHISFDKGLAYGNGLTPELVSYFPRADGPDQWMLDLGCGNKRYEELCRSVTGLNYVGVDFSGDEPDLLADVHALPFKAQSFDFILSIAVLEHVQFPDVAMAEAFRVLKPGGLLVGTVAFLETFHLDSHFHMTHLGTLRVLRTAGFDIVAIAPNRQWPGLRAQAVMSLFPALPRRLREAAVMPLDALSKILWAFKRVFRREEASDRQRLLETTGGFRFVARRPA